MARKPVKQSRSMTPFYAVLGAVAVIGVGWVVWQMASGGNAATQPVEVAIDPAELSRVQGISMGDPNAPVVIYEFADFQCPGCMEFATFTAPLIKERLVDTGLARFVYYDFPLPHFPHSFLAARGARCANEQGGFWLYHDVLFARQNSWSMMQDATDFFVELSGEVGLDEGDFGACLRSDRFQGEVSQSLQLGQMLGVGRTPTLFVNMKRLDDLPTISELEEIVRAELGPTSATPGAGAELADSTASGAAAPSL